MPPSANRLWLEKGRCLGGKFVETEPLAPARIGASHSRLDQLQERVHGSGRAWKTNTRVPPTVAPAPAPDQCASRPALKVRPAQRGCLLSCAGRPRFQSERHGAGALPPAPSQPVTPGCLDPHSQSADMLRTKRQSSGEPGAAADAQVAALERENQRLRDLVRCCLAGLLVVLVVAQNVQHDTRGGEPVPSHLPALWRRRWGAGPSGLRCGGWGRHLPSAPCFYAPPLPPTFSPAMPVPAAGGADRTGRLQEQLPLQVPGPRHGLAVGAHLGAPVRRSVIRAVLCWAGHDVLQGGGAATASLSMPQCLLTCLLNPPHHFAITDALLLPTACRTKRPSLLPVSAPPSRPHTHPPRLLPAGISSSRAPL